MNNAVLGRSNIDETVDHNLTKNMENSFGKNLKWIGICGFSNF
jgi:hypothetical protein